jgi:glutamate-1-semialdehyde 2,1-aminomutase
MYQLERSRSLHQRACLVMPGGVSSNNRANWAPFPLFYERASGSRVWDVDGNEYIDYVLGRGPMILGHSPPEVLNGVIAQLKTGQFFAGQTEVEILLAEKIRELVPCAEMTRFCNSGSEAVHAAIRLARSVTNKKKIIRFVGHYHGWFDTIAWGFSPAGNVIEDEPSAQSMSRGQSAEDAANIIVAPWNDGLKLKKVLETHAKDVAGIITEPVMYNGFNGGIVPIDGYLRTIRQLCDEHKCLLIFDEIQTGFRLSLGGAQSRFGVIPDLATFAKALGGGVCIAALSGREQWMSYFSKTNTIHTGTYNAYPPTIAGALANLAALSCNDGERLRRIYELGSTLKSGLEKLIGETSLPLQVRGMPPAFTTTFRRANDVVVDYWSCTRGLDVDLVRAWHLNLQENGIRISPEGLWYLSAAHTELDIIRTLDGAKKALKNLEETHH